MWVRITAIAALMLASLSTWADSVAVSLIGLDSELEKNARVYLSLTALEDRTDLSEAAIRRLHRRAPEQIRKSLQPFGYYNPDIRRQITQESSGNWRATYTINVGTVVRVREVKIEVTGPGKDLAEIKKVLATHLLRPDASLRHDHYEDLKTTLRRVAFNKGYFDASYLVRELKVDPAAATADIKLILETGERYSFGRVSIEQDALSDQLFRRYVNITEGEPFEQSSLLDAQYALQDSGYYAAVEVVAQRDQAEGLRVPVSVKATKRKPQRYSAGIGYGSDVGPRLSLGWENRLLNSRGHQANIDLRISALSLDFSTRYSVPIGDPRTERLSWSLAQRTEDLGDDANSQRLELGATETKVLGEWQRNLYVQLTREISEISAVETTDTLLLPGVSFSRSRSDSPVQPRKGDRIRLDLRGSHETLGSDTNFLRLKLETKLIRPVGRGRLLLRGDLGASLVSEFSRLPGSQRFFVGGDRSVRGFALNALGPQDTEGRNIGGRHFLSGSAELEWPIVGRWSAAVFMDAGNAFNEFGDELEYSVGVGGRAATPVGVIRLDLAKPVSEGGQSVRLHLSLGLDL